MSVIACVSAADPLRQTIICLVTGVNLSVTRTATNEPVEVLVSAATTTPSANSMAHKVVPVETSVASEPYQWGISGLTLVSTHILILDCFVVNCENFCFECNSCRDRIEILRPAMNQVLFGPFLTFSIFSVIF